VTALLARLSPLLAEIQSGVMARSLLIALVVVSPFWFLLRRRMRRDVQPAEVPDAAPAQAAPALEDLVEEIGRLGADTGEDPTSPVTIRVPRGLTIDGDPAPDGVVDAIVRDAIARSGLVPTAELDTTEGRIIECLPRATTPG